MSIRQPIAFAALAFATLLAVACKPEPAAPAASTNTEPAPPVSIAAPAPTDALDASDISSPALDAKAFAGTFGGDDDTLELRADSTFRLSAKADATKAITGTWSTEQEGEHLRLTPAGKGASTRLYDVVSRDEIQKLAADGTPAADPVAASLHRQ
ncbi:MAG TPA: hypothetical protein VKM35_09390 [Arenimonas sp.]|uniref:hypothetical protein n=1 Tax=Arenimonas sp. TaxID=1872635 RepID=UPI002C3C0FC5|nr:hypothetical protein [Arenimonas sp.]HMB57408.1 hypothetical protein [Arenimonas sp.]